jgi:hypothetical protein
MATSSLTAEWHIRPMHIVAISTHQHRRGTGISVNRLDANGADMTSSSGARWGHRTSMVPDGARAPARQFASPATGAIRRSSRPFRPDLQDECAPHELLLPRRRRRGGDGPGCIRRLRSSASCRLP